MKVGPKYKICKRLGSSVFEKCQTQQYQLSESRTAKNRSRKRGKAMSDFGRQLIEKQRARLTYGVTETQLARYATSVRVDRSQTPTQQFINALELRLDNVVYRAGFAPTRRMARQLVSHGHITVNGRRMNIPSHELGIGDTVGVREQSAQKTPFAALKTEGASQAAPSWLTADMSALTATVEGEPAGAVEPTFDSTLVLEFYSR